MNKVKEAIEDLRDYLEWNDKNSFSRLSRDNNIEIVLNLISKLQKELDKKDKVIDLMAEEITYMDYMGKRPSKKHIKEYFYKKVEKENE